MTKADEIAELRKRIDELERANKPKEPFVPEPWTPIDRTAGMSMPREAMQEMVNAVPDHVMHGVMRDAHAPTSPSSAGGITPTREEPAVRGSGWRDATPLSNPPGTRMVDAIAIADDVQQRAGKK
jgi:hypothetical protein